MALVDMPSPPAKARGSAAAGSQAPSARPAWLLLAQSVLPFWRRALLALGLLVLAKLAAVAVPWLLKRIVDDFSRPRELIVLPVFLLIAYAALRLASGVFTELRDLAFVRVTQRAVADFTLRAFDHLHALGARFHVQRQTGAVVRDVERGTSGVAYLLGNALLTVLPTLIEIGAIVVIVASAYSWPFTVAILGTFAGYVVVTRTLTERRAQLQRERNELDSAANSRLVDSLLNYETVKAFANERFESARLGALLDLRMDLGLRTQRALSLLNVSQSSVIACGVAAIMLLAGQRVASGALSVGDLVLINAYIIQVVLPLNALGLIFRESRDALVNAERLFRLLAQPLDVQETATPPQLKITRGEVRFENVSFGYDAARQVLWNVDLSIAPGGTVAVVGGSGSGKSTLARLLLRFYEPSAGRILIDGQDIAHVSQQSLRRQLGIVPQDTVLFNDTIAYNIAYSRPGATLPAIIEAARAAHVHEFICNLPQQYDTPVGERGLKLSGGEKQRIAIARAILKDPPVLIFDEATSALDTRSERAIQSELERISRDRTTLVIAHRLSTVVDADEILVLERGRVVERGRHQELLARKGVYSQMWALQQKQNELESTEQKLSMQPVNLVSLLAGVVDALTPALEARGITLYTAFSDGGSRVTGDPGGLQQVLWELATHAADLSPEGGRLELQLERAGAVAGITISATRADSSVSAAVVVPIGAAGALRSRPISPTPLDPLRVRSTIEANRGRFAIDESRPGLIRYRVELPLRAVCGTGIDDDTPERQLSPTANALRGLSVMTVDDQGDALEALGLVLRAHGAEVIAVTTGRGAIDYLAARPRERWPQVLICDIALGDEDGYEVMRRLRALESERQLRLEQRLPAIALTGYADVEDRMRALMAGFQIHLAKPVESQELVATVEALARRSAPAAARAAS